MLEIRKLNKDELYLVNKIQESRGLQKINKSFWDSNKNNWVVYAAFDDDNIVCISYLFPYNRIPHTDYPSGYIAELGGTYTIPEYRNKGIATKVVYEMLYNVKNDLPLLDAIVADSTDEGYPIYKKLGFIDSDTPRIWKQL